MPSPAAEEDGAVAAEDGAAEAADAAAVIDIMESDEEGVDNEGVGTKSAGDTGNISRLISPSGKAATSTATAAAPKAKTISPAATSTDSAKKPPPLPIPECPPKPAQPNSPHPEWRVIPLPSPKCIKNNAGELEWVFFYFAHKLNGDVRWTAPPPPGALEAVDAMDVDVCERPTESCKATNGGTIQRFFVPLPSAESYARELSGEPEPVATEPTEVGEDEPPRKLTPAELTFTGLVPVKLYMKPKAGQQSFPEKAREIGIDPTGLTRQRLTKAVRDYFVEKVHGGNENEYLASDCFKGETQDIDRERKERVGAKRAKAVEEKADGAKKKPKESHRKAMPVKVALEKYGHRGLVNTDTGLRCSCNNVSLEGSDETSIVRHLDRTKVHEQWERRREKECEQQGYLRDFRAAKEEEKEKRQQLVGTRNGNLTKADIDFGKETVKELLMNGIPLKKLDGSLRKYLQKRARLKLSHPTDLTGNIPELLKEEEVLQRVTLRDKPQSLIYDATPRQGDLFAMVSRKMDVDLETRTAEATHTLMYVSTLKKSLNADSLSAEVSQGMMARQILHENVPAAMMDRCYTNSAAANETNEVAAVMGNLERLISFCMSHLACNAGDQASFPLLDLFWTLLQKVFALSPAAQNIWTDVTEIAFPSHSETRWFSKYDVLEKMYLRFPDLLTVMVKITEEKISPANASALLKILLDEGKSFQLRIELAAYVDGLRELRNLCYYFETDATDVPFKCGERIDGFLDMFPGGAMKPLPSADRLIMQALEWATKPEADGGGGFTPPSSAGDNAPAFQPATTADVEAEINRIAPRRPRRAAAERVRNVTRALESAQARNQRLREEAEVAAAKAQEDADREAARLAVLESIVQSQADRPPLSPDEWRAHIHSGICPAFEYFTSRIVSGGDRFETVEFFRGARIFDPSYAKTLSREEAFELIDKMAHYPVFARGGEQSIIARLKKGWNAYHANARLVSSTNFGKSNKKGTEESSVIATWHYRMFLRIDGEKADDRSCRYCTNKSENCSCYEKLKVWWEACELAALVLPSSGTAERVFSLVSSLFSDKQARLLTDAIRLSLFLAFNKRGAV